ncbi:MAG: pantetheine-phosphate adenylyltransferase [Deltaproteobacteria bacterium]|nr:pantetheine-phosphate adenylyltransferase [Deltaproteobacteria bacterium]
MNKNTAVYPGSFDPITNGHLDILHRGLRVFDRIIIAVARNSQKNPLFPIDERVELIRRAVGNDSRIEVDTFDGLLVNYVFSKGARVILRGLRAISDFEYEFQVAQTNRTINEKIETIFMMTSLPFSYLSSSVVREVAVLNGPVDSFVPEIVKEALEKKFAERQALPREEKKL